ncbi:MAG TPA: hypothetical protein VEF76_03835 [Patescibacteria group bacterium]|nr:hypothetical protein [Patescibacteria group bacterium]
MSTPVSENSSTAPSLRVRFVKAICAGGRRCRDTIESAAHAVRQGYDNFHLTIAEGNYRIKPKSLWTLITGQGSRPEVDVAAAQFGTAMIDTGRSFGKRMMWASAIALVSMQAMVWVAGGIALAGAGLFVLEFMQSRRAGKETIQEVNFAGQHIEGTRADLYHLHNAQEKIMNLGGTFQQASMESTSETIERIIASVAEHSKRVKVLDGGRYGAACDEYEFSEPSIKLVKDRPAPPIVFHSKTQSLSDLNIKNSFDSAAAYDAEEIARRFLALEQALPPEALAKVAEARKAGNSGLKTAA